mmetsp:Transcript_91261/g.181975  ORF Transcript_91261/g.181975 Transcript_91261/m.181975 type:complete len:81 (-) Transcript_91261:664-906(-)
MLISEYVLFAVKNAAFHYFTTSHFIAKILCLILWKATSLLSIQLQKIVRNFSFVCDVTKFFTKINDDHVGLFIWNKTTAF